MLFRDLRWNVWLWISVSGGGGIDDDDRYHRLVEGHQEQEYNVWSTRSMDCGHGCGNMVCEALALRVVGRDVGCICFPLGGITP